MGGLPQQTIPAATIIMVQIPTKKGLTVLKITNESPRAMQYRDKPGIYGDPIPVNGGSCAYHKIHGDKIPHTFYVSGTAGDTFSVYFAEEE